MTERADCRKPRCPRLLLSRVGLSNEYACQESVVTRRVLWRGPGEPESVPPDKRCFERAAEVKG